MEQKPVTRLNDEIFLVQLEDFISTFDNKMKKQTNKDKRALIIGLIPFILSIIIFIITMNPLFLSIGTGYFGTVAIIKLFKDDKDHNKEFNNYLESISNSSNVVSLENNEPVDLFLKKERIIEKEEQDFLNPEFKAYANSDSNDNYKESENKKDITDTIYALSKEDAMKRIVFEYDVYSTCYNLPPMNISPREWDVLFDVIYRKLKKKGIESKLYDYMSFIQRYTFAYALLHKQSSINIYSFLNQMHMFEKVGFTKLNIKSIISEVNENLKVKDKKVISFSKKYPFKK